MKGVANTLAPSSAAGVARVEQHFPRLSTGSPYLDWLPYMDLRAQSNMQAYPTILHSFSIKVKKFWLTSFCIDAFGKTKTSGEFLCYFAENGGRSKARLGRYLRRFPKSATDLRRFSASDDSKCDKVVLRQGKQRYARLIFILTVKGPKCIKVNPDQSAAQWHSWSKFKSMPSLHGENNTKCFPELSNGKIASFSYCEQWKSNARLLRARSWRFEWVTRLYFKKWFW